MMLRSLFVAMLCAVLVPSVCGQLRLGIKTGLGISDVYNEYLPGMNPRFVGTAGLALEYAPASWLSVSSGVDLLPRGWKARSTVDGGGGPYLVQRFRVVYTNLQVPLAIRIFPGHRYRRNYLMLGGALELNVAHRVVKKVNGVKSRIDPSPVPIAPVSYSLQAGVGRQFPLSERYFFQAEVSGSYDVVSRFLNGTVAVRGLRRVGR